MVEACRICGATAADKVVLLMKRACVPAVVTAGAVMIRACAPAVATAGAAVMIRGAWATPDAMVLVPKLAVALTAETTRADWGKADAIVGAPARIVVAAGYPARVVAPANCVIPAL